MKRAVAQRPAHVGFRGVLALLVAVVALLCVFGHADRDGSGTHPPVAQHVHVPTASEGSGGTAAPCGKKVIVDHSTQRVESPSSKASCPGPAAPHTAPTTSLSQHSGILSGGPAPPPPTTLHSVLRI
ncbi:hypothetical protein GCM10009579_70370 [Streptomyces javensis]|uniref:Secreted protein n=1 Tax=Streptomyces javensis TaxID=114698 RepID=A0ABN1X9T2_9ACTN